jgi:restriction endonuclease S subunit
MALKQFTTDFFCIGEQRLLSPSIGYRYFFDIQKAEIYPASKSIKLKYILSGVQSSKVSKGELDDYEVLVDLENIERRFNNLINLEEVTEIGSDKTILKDGDIVIPKLQPRMGNIFLNLEHKRYIASTELLEYKINEDNNPIFLYYLFTSAKFLLDLGKLESGKTHRRVNPMDLLEVKIPIISREMQDEAVKFIEPIQDKIRFLKENLISPQSVINRAFAEYFNFDLQKFAKLKKEKFRNINFSEFSGNKDLRSSAKFHRLAGKFVAEQLNSVFNKKIKDFIAEPIVLGASVSPINYDDSGDYYYISMACIKNWQFEYESAKLLSAAYRAENQSKTIKKNDILIARSGEGTIGKVALIDDENLQGIFADFTMRIRLKNYSHLFAYYYFRSEYFQYLIEINKKGLGNNTNIFPSQIQEFQIPSISLKEQEKIVDKIKTELDKQDEIRRQINTEREKIDGIISRKI